MTTQEYIDLHKITATVTHADSNPSMPDLDGDHWRVTLHRRTHTGKRYNANKIGEAIVARMSLYFSKGYGHNGAEPTAAEVLDCLRSDAWGADELFETWACNCGYDPDSRNAEKIYNTVRRQTARLRKFLGETFDDFMRTEEV